MSRSDYPVLPLWVMRLFWAIATTWCAAGFANAQAAAPTGLEQQVRDIGQVVTGIASYIKWPASHNALQLCVTGDTRFAATLLDGSAQARSQPMRALRLPGSPSTAFSSCDIVYVGALAVAERRRLLQQLDGQPVLSISEPDAPCTGNIMFCLKFRDEQVAFEANLDAIGKSGLRVHPNVLQLARRKGSP
ncbi:MAG: YfiR family protein [Janthinobacterium lividum]